MKPLDTWDADRQQDLAKIDAHLRKWGRKNPLIKGGQGRSGEQLEAEAKGFFVLIGILLILAFCVILGTLLYSHLGGA